MGATHLDRLVDQMTRRIRRVAAWQAFLAWITWSVVVVYLLLLAAVWAYPYWPSGSTYLEGIATLCVVCAMLLLAVSAMAAAAAHRNHPVSDDPLLAACELDQRLGLHDRLASALQLRGQSSPFVHALLADAQRHQPDELGERLYPLTPPAVASLGGVLALASLLLLGALAIAMPGAPAQTLQATLVADEKTRQTLEAVAQQLKKLADRIAAQPGSATRLQKEPITGELRKVAQTLQRRGTTRKQATQRVSQGRRKLEGVERTNAEKRRRLAQDLAALAKELGKDRLTQEVAGKLARGKLKQASQGLAHLARRITQQRLLPAEKKRLRKRLESTKKQLRSKSTKDLADQMQQAAAALGGARNREAGQAMAQLAKKLQQLQQLVNRQDQLGRLAREAQVQLDWAKVKINERDKYTSRRQSQDRKYRDQNRDRGKPVRINPNQVRLGSGGQQGRGSGPSKGPCIGCQFKGSCAECPCRTADKDCPKCKKKCSCPRCWINLSLDRKSSSRSRGPGSLSMGQPKAGHGSSKRSGEGKRLSSKRNPAQLKAHRIGQEGQSQIMLIKGTNDKAQSGLEYRNMIEKFRKAAEERIVKEKVPLGRREYIKQYFQRIKPK